jgi:hypothetical protein
MPFISAVPDFRNKKQEQLRTVPVEKTQKCEKTKIIFIN